MPVLNFSYATIKDSAAFQDYVRRAADLMQNHNIETVVRGTYRTTLRGNEKIRHVTAVFRYPDLENALRFYNSSAYRDLIPLRDAACEMEIQFYDE